ncbi:MAG TPA: hypothetical protein VM818_00885 [Vicinamibacterales bacterium]|jgi:hypothetical protein|nr:hypothetical protein [Vicinamibacterales bacterium]
MHILARTLLPPGAAAKLTLADQQTLPGSGIVALAYSLPGAIGPSTHIRRASARFL